MTWKPIEDCPEDTLVFLKWDHQKTDIETPMIVVGEVTTFKGKKHHLWRGPYDSVVQEFKKIGFDEKFTHWREI